MKKTKAISIAMCVVILLGILTSCGKPAEEAIIGKWVLTEINGESSPYENFYVSFYDGGNIKETCHIFYDSYGISYKIQDNKIIFIYYGSVASDAKFKIKGNELTLQFDNHPFYEDSALTFTKSEE